MGTVTITGKVRVQSDAFIRQRAEFRRQYIKLGMDLLELLIYLCMCSTEVLPPLFMVSMDLTQRINL